MSSASGYFGEGDQWRKGRCDELDSLSWLRSYLLFRKGGFWLQDTHKVEETYF